MKIEEFPGLDARTYELIGPFAMNLKRIRENGNPITTSKLHTWYVGFDKSDNISCFCSVRFAEGSKNMQIGSLFILTGGKKTFNSLIKHIVVKLTEKELGIRAYSNNDNLAAFIKLGFKVIKKGVNWHNMKYECVRSDAKSSKDNI